MAIQSVTVKFSAKKTNGANVAWTSCGSLVARAPALLAEARKRHSRRDVTGATRSESRHAVVPPAQPARAQFRGDGRALAGRSPFALTPECVRVGLVHDPGVADLLSFEATLSERLVHSRARDPDVFCRFGHAQKMAVLC